MVKVANVMSCAFYHDKKKKKKMDPETSSRPAYQGDDGGFLEGWW